MSPLVVSLWLLNLALDTAGQLAFKAAAAQAERRGLDTWGMVRLPGVWFGIACYVLEFFAWLGFLSLVPLSQAVLMAAANVVTVTLAGRLLFGEATSPLRGAGVAMIAAGVALVGWGAV